MNVGQAPPPNAHKAPRYGDLRHYDADRRRLLLLWRFLDSDRFTFRRKQAFIATVQRKLRSGRYKHDLAPKLWTHWIKQGLRRFLREHPRAGGYDMNLVHQLASEIAEREHARILRGDYPDLTVDGSARSGRPRVAPW
jgi:hypothetical protein